ncbi:MAG: hypothetical protein ACQXXL_03470 [Candidatus Methanosuratincola sp.]
MGRRGSNKWSLFAIFLILVFGIIAIPVVWPNAPWRLSIGELPTPGQPQQSNGLSNTLNFVLMDARAGSGIASKALYVYEGTTLKESLTTGTGGVIESSLAYPSGAVLNVKIDTGDLEVWKTVTVPQHSAAAVQAGTPTQVTIYSTVAPTLTDAMLYGAGSSIADAGSYNKTASGSTQTFTYAWTVGSAGTGAVKSDADPLYGYTPKIVMYLILSGYDYANVGISGMDGMFSKGSTNVYYKVVHPAQISKQTIGTGYASEDGIVMDGVDGVTFTMSLSGYSASSGAATCQIYLYEGSDPAYYQTQGSFGADATQLCETTFTIVE